MALRIQVHLTLGFQRSRNLYAPEAPGLPALAQSTFDHVAFRSLACPVVDLNVEYEECAVMFQAGSQALQIGLQSGDNAGGEARA